MTLPTDRIMLADNQGWDSRILVCRCGALVQAFVVVGGRYVVLIDTLINPHTALAMVEIAREHLGDGRQLLVVNTHADWDHCWGNQVFAGPNAAYPAPIIATRRCAERLRSATARQTLAELRAEQLGRFDDVLLTPPTVLFAEQLTIDIGDLTLELFATPGHQPDHVSLYIPEIKTLLAGDASEAPFPFVESAAGLPELRASLARMAALAPDATLYCHAPVTSGPALLQENIAYFDRLEDRCRAALAHGAPPRPAADADVAALIGCPLAEAIPSHLVPVESLASYQEGHQAAIRAMLAWLAP